MDELAESLMSDIKDNYIDKNMADEGAEGGQDNVLREEDVDEEMFIFPDRASEAAGEEERYTMFLMCKKR